MYSYIGIIRGGPRKPEPIYNVNAPTDFSCLENLTSVVAKMSSEKVAFSEKKEIFSSH